MKKTAVIYDKWLSSLGGGEVVACNFARILADLGYQTTFVCGKLIDHQVIKNSLDINLSDVRFVEVWNDEAKLKQLTKDADVFINVSFMDYSYAFAKFNLIYTFFPTPADDNFKGKLITQFILPLSNYLLKPIETISVHKSVSKFALYYLNIGQNYHLNFKANLKNFSKSNLESFNYLIQNALISDTKITINHFNNSITFNLQIIPTQTTVYLKINNPIWTDVSFVSPEIPTLMSHVPEIDKIQNRLNSKLRSGLYGNTIARLNTYQQILATSGYAQKWIKKYWHQDSQILYPPVPLIRRDVKIIKKNIICSVGRFFTLGHGKKQDIMIRAFKQMCDQGLVGWELHLAGGLNSEVSSREFASQLQKEASGYPIFFHFNKSRIFIENLYQKSKIYWHAAGFGINKNKHPIKFEHFGITPLEAMSCGCVPVLFNGGGLSEVISIIGLDPKNHLFQTSNELIKLTQNIINQKISLPKNTPSVLEDKFSLKRFQEKVRLILPQ